MISNSVLFPKKHITTLCSTDFHKLAGEPRSMQNIVPMGKYILNYKKKTGYKLDFKNISGLYIQITLYFCSFLSKYPISNLMVSSVEMPLCNFKGYETGVCL